MATTIQRKNTIITALKLRDNAATLNLDLIESNHWEHNLK